MTVQKAAPSLAAIDLNLLVALDALLREESVGAAGRRIGLSQPAMSHALAGLRELLNDELLVREDDAENRARTRAHADGAATLDRNPDHAGRKTAVRSDDERAKLSHRHERLWVGDLVYNGMHAYLADGYYAEWLACLDALERTLDRDATLYVGHGEPGGVNLIATQRRYVEAFVEAVERHLDDDAEERRSAVVGEMKRLLPTDDLAFLMELSVDPVAAKLGAS